MTTSVIDLADLPDNSCKLLTDLKFEYGNDRQIQSRIRAIYTEQKAILEDKLNEWFEATNSDLIVEVKGFIKKSLSKQIDQGILGPKLVFPAYILIGWQGADYSQIVDLLQEKAIAQFKKLKLARISPRVTKRAHALQVLDQVGDAEQLLVVVEQTETLEQQALASIVRFLYNHLNEGKLSKALILFCMSTGATGISSMIPLDYDSTMHPIRHISRKPSDIDQQLEDWLMRFERQDFKISHCVLNDIYNDFIERNPSISYLRYICQYAMYLHLMTHCSIVLDTNPKELTSMLNSHCTIIEEIKELESIREAAPKLKCGDNAAVSRYCLEKIQYSRVYHTFMIDQIQYYFKLLRDETKETFPADVSDIYGQLMINDDLSKSKLMVDAVLNVRNFSHETLLKRLEKSTEIYQTVPKEIDTKDDVFIMLAIIKEKVRNNDDCSELKRELSKKLLKHLQILKNPMKQPLAELFYFDGLSQLKARLSTSHRCGFMKVSMDGTYYGILVQLITNSAEEISLHDLFNDYVQIVNERKPCLSSLKRPTSPCLKRKQTPKRSRRDTASSEEVPDEGILKALFIDFIQSLVHQGTIVMDTRSSKKGNIRRTTWPC